MGGYLWYVDKVPETGKYSPGQKAYFLVMAIFGAIMVLMGLTHNVGDTVTKTPEFKTCAFRIGKIA